MKRIVLLFVIGLVGLAIQARSAAAQRSGSLQATARVVDTRGSSLGLDHANQLLTRMLGVQQPSATIETAFGTVAVDLEALPKADLYRPRQATITIHYLRN